MPVTNHNRLMKKEISMIQTHEQDPVTSMGIRYTLGKEGYCMHSATGTGMDNLGTETLSVTESFHHS